MALWMIWFSAGPWWWLWPTLSGGNNILVPTERYNCYCLFRKEKAERSREIRKCCQVLVSKFPPLYKPLLQESNGCKLTATIVCLDLNATTEQPFSTNASPRGSLNPSPPKRRTKSSSSSGSSPTSTKPHWRENPVSQLLEQFFYADPLPLCCFFSIFFFL